MKSVEATVDIKVSPELALDAFTEIDLLREWWGVERALIEKRIGGMYVLAWNISEHGFKYVSSGIITSYHAGEHLEIGNLVYFNPERPILGPMTLLVRVRKSGEATVLHVLQDGYQDGTDWDWYYKAVREAWPKVLIHLKNYLENLERT